MTASILVVDDSRIARKIVRKALSEGDFAIREAASGLECVAACQEQMPDLVFLDLTMPEISGFETLTRLKQLNPEIQVVVLSADVQHSSRQAVEQLGAVAFLRKPLDRDDVRDLLRRLLPGSAR
jgi:CheY-like chemotaxis protein